MATVGDGTTLNNGTGGDSILTEDTFTDTRTGTSGIKVATSKLRTGANGVDGGSVVSEKNDLPVTDVALIRLVDALLRFEEENASRIISISDKLGLGDVSTAPRSHLSVVTTFAAITSSAILIGANVSRKALCIINDGGVSGAGNLFILFTPPGVNPGVKPVSTSYYTVKLVPGAYYEVPGVFTGRIDGVWDAATGNAIVTELS